MSKKQNTVKELRAQLARKDAQIAELQAQRDERKNGWRGAIDDNHDLSARVTNAAKLLNSMRDNARAVEKASPEGSVDRLCCGVSAVCHERAMRVVLAILKP